MSVMTAESPLLRTSRETPTDWRNDSSDVVDLARAVAQGASGATANPGSLLEVLTAGTSR